MHISQLIVSIILQLMKSIRNHFQFSRRSGIISFYLLQSVNNFITVEKEVKKKKNIHKIQHSQILIKRAFRYPLLLQSHLQKYKNFSIIILN